MPVRPEPPSAPAPLLRRDAPSNTHAGSVLQAYYTSELGTSSTARTGHRRPKRCPPLGEDPKEAVEIACHSCGSSCSASSSEPVTSVEERGDLFYVHPFDGPYAGLRRGRLAGWWPAVLTIPRRAVGTGVYSSYSFICSRRFVVTYARYHGQPRPSRRSSCRGSRPWFHGGQILTSAAY